MRLHMIIEVSLSVYKIFFLSSTQLVPNLQRFRKAWYWIYRNADEIKNLLSAPISTLVDDSSEIQKVLEQIESQLPESLRVKLWPAGHLPFFRAEVKAAQQRIELRHSQIPLKADITQKCKLLNQKKATLDAKADISASTRRLSLLEKELAELEEQVRTTQRLIQEEKVSIANSKQEAQEITEQIQAEFAEIKTLSQQIVAGDDKDDEAVIARADAVRAEAIHAIEEFWN